MSTFIRHQGKTHQKKQVQKADIKIHHANKEKEIKSVKVPLTAGELKKGWGTHSAYITYLFLFKTRGQSLVVTKKTLHTEIQRKQIGRERK